MASRVFDSLAYRYRSAHYHQYSAHPNSSCKAYCQYDACLGEPDKRPYTSPGLGSHCCNGRPPPSYAAESRTQSPARRPPAGLSGVMAWSSSSFPSSVPFSERGYPSRKAFSSSRRGRHRSGLPGPELAVGAAAGGPVHAGDSGQHRSRSAQRQHQGMPAACSHQSSLRLESKSLEAVRGT